MDVVDHRRIFEDTTSVMRSFREDMFRNINYVDGTQYSEDDIRYLDSQRRPHYTLNMTKPEVMAFVGAEEANRIMTRAEPGEGSDAKMTEMINLLLDQDNIETSAYYQISIAARDAAIYRYGVTSQTWERTRKYPEGQYMIRALDPRDVWWDYHPSEMDFENSEYIIHSRWYTPEHAIQLFVTDPARRSELMDMASKFLGQDITKTPYVARTSSSNSLVSIKDKSKNLGNANHYQYRYSDYFDKGLFRIIEMHDRRVVIKQMIFDYKNNDVVEIPEEMKNDKEFIRAQLELRDLSGDERALVPVEMFEYWQSISAPDIDQKELLSEKRYPVQDGGYAIKILPFYNFNHDRLGLRSMVDDLIDPQDIINKSESSKLLLINRALNPTIILGPTALDDEIQKAALKANRTGAIIHAQNPADIHYKYPDMGVINLLTGDTLQFMQLMGKTSTINESLKGIRPSDASGTLVSRLSSYSESMHTIVWQNITNFILNVEKKHLAMIQYHMRMPRMVRQLAPNGKWEDAGVMNQFDALTNSFINDPSVGKFDMKLDKTKYTKSDRQQNLDKIFQYFAQTDPETKMDLNPVILELLQLPGMEAVLEAAKTRQGLLLDRTRIEAINLRKQLNELMIQEQLLPDMAEVQKGGLDVQKLNNQAQELQLTAAIQQLLMQLQQMNPQQPQQTQPAI
jgi:hypothetical protein